VDAAREAGVEAAHGAHDVDALEVSRPFSSKIGVFWTASSYGPGCRSESRGLAFHGVGG
jgi:hypothetical protein